MGRVIFYRSPFDSTKKSEKEFSGSIEEALIFWRIEKESLCVTINGKTPDDCDIKYIIQENDLIEIRRLVHGSSSRSKGAWGTVLQIVGLIIVAVATWGQGVPAYLAYIGIAAGIAGGALQARAARLALKEAGSIKEQEIDIATNNFSVNSATNENRPLRNLILPMGSIFYAPDYNAIAFKSYTGGEFTPVTRMIDYYFFPGGDYDYGVLNPAADWQVMPINYIATGLPQVELMFPADINLAQLKTDVLANNDAFRDVYCNEVGYKKPIICYHSQSGDPLFGRYNSFALHVSIYVESANINYFTMVLMHLGSVTANMAHLFSDVYSDDFGFYDYKYLEFPVAGSYKLYIPGFVGGPTYYSTTTSNACAAFRAWLLDELNGGDWGTSFKDKSFAIKTASLFNTFSSVIKEAYEYATHVFNFGLGDMAISNRRLEKIPIASATGAGYGEIDKDTYELNPIYATTFLTCYNRIKAISNKNLFNDNSPQAPIPMNDHGTYNFAQIEGPKGYGACHFNIAGRLYAATASGMATNSVKLEVQVKKSSDEDWQSSNIYYYENNNTKKFTRNEFISPVMIGNFPIDESLQIRIRKITRDTDNNNGENICELNIENIFFVDYGLNANTPMDIDYRPKQIEGLAIVANSEMSSQTNRYAAQVDSKCWVYDFDDEDWTWDFNRNPAFWFLYFAYGGFLNVPADGSYTYPYSPTKGWVNYPGHPDSTVHMFGVGLTSAQVDLEKILEWAQFCDDRNLKMDMVLKDDTSCADVLERIANIGRGSVTYYNGKLSVVYEDEQQTPTCMFGMGNIIAGSFSVDYSVSDKIRKVVANFADRDYEWENQTVEAIVPYSSDENLKVIEMSLEGVTERQQAQREANILAARQFYQRRNYRWKVDFEGLIAKRGDLVYLSHDSTQYGYSGRIKKFIMTGGNITGIETTAILADSGIVNMTMRYPDGQMVIYECHVDGNNLIFDEPYPIEKAPVWIDNSTDNNLSDYSNSIPEDFVFIAGAKETPGKIVRISEIKVDEEMNFEITAVDEDPAMWAYEFNDLYDPPIEPESLDDVEVVLILENVNALPIGNGLVKINWEGSEFIQIINEFSGLPIEANGAYSFTGGEVILELVKGEKYTLRIEPFAIGTPYKAEHKKVVVWA